MTNPNSIGDHAKDERFNDIEALDLDGFEASLAEGMDRGLVYLEAESYLNVAEARALHEWLGKALP